MNYINVDIISLDHEQGTVVARITPDTIKKPRESYPAHNFKQPDVNTEIDFLKALAIHGRSIAEQIEKNEQVKPIDKPKLLIEPGFSSKFSVNELFGSVVLPIVNTKGAPSVLG
jgi:hypothetical protein